MFILAAIGWGCVALGGFAAAGGFASGDLWLGAMRLSGMVSGVLFLALDRGLSLLADIRDALCGPAKKPAKASSFDEAVLGGE